jgi:hypothetical protein
VPENRVAFEGPIEGLLTVRRPALALGFRLSVEGLRVLRATLNVSACSCRRTVERGKVTPSCALIRWYKAAALSVSGTVPHRLLGRPAEGGVNVVESPDGSERLELRD